MTTNPPSLDWTAVDAVLFDLDGVITPTAEVHMHAWHEMFTEFLAGRDVAAYGEADYFEHIDGRPRYDGVAALLASRGIELPWGDPGDTAETETVCGLGNRKNLLFGTVLARDGVKPYPGSVELLDALDQRGTAMAIVSSSANAPDVLRAAGLFDRFETIVDGAVARQRQLPGKPRPDTYQHAADVLGVPHDRAVVVEDAVSGVQAGAAGDFAAVVGVDRGAGAETLRSHGADLVVDDLAELVPAVRGDGEHLASAGASHRPPQAADPLDRHVFPVHPWRLTESTYDPAHLGRNETLFAVANGYLGMRGNVEEGRESFAQGTFINGFHETFTIQHAEEAFGFARVGQTMVNVPDAKLIRLYVDDEPLLLSIADLDSYDRTLDFRTGRLTRSLIWRTPAGKRVRVESSRMVSMTDRHLAVLTFEVTLLDCDAPVAISSQLLNRQDGEDEYHVRDAAMGQGADPRKTTTFERRVLVPQSIGVEADSDRMIQGYRCAESAMTLAVAVDHVFETDNAFESNCHFDPDVARMTYRVDAEAGKPIKLVKYATFHTSRGVPVQELVNRCRRTLDRTLATELDHLLQQQAQWYDAYWERSDVEVEGPPEVQQAVRWNLFQLAQAVGRAEGMGVPAKGVTGSGYSGHYFWDTEVYTLPFFTYTTPQCSRSALRFRYRLLDAARLRAEQMTQRGALFPWRTINGEEASAYYAAGTAQYHIDADISYALSQYVAATGDRDFLAREAVDILVETARMWVDLGFWRVNGDGVFHIHAVTGPDEYTTVVNDNLFTNVMAQGNLRAAADTVRWLADHDPVGHARMVSRLGLGDDEPAEWRRAADRMFVPFEPHLGIHPQDAHFLDREVWDLEATPADHRPLLLHYHPLVIYRFQVIKQADVVLALFLRGDAFTPEQKRANFEYYDPITTGDSTLSAVVQSIIAAEVGYHELALRYFYQSLFVDLADLHANASDGVHVASTGGVWSALVYGFGGLRDFGGRITIDPRLPEQWTALTYRLSLRGARLRVRVGQDEVTLTLETGDLAEVWVRDKPVQVTAGDPVTVPLDGQGERVPGDPPAWVQEGVRRADGTVITASVPLAT